MGCDSENTSRTKVSSLLRSKTGDHVDWNIVRDYLNDQSVFTEVNTRKSKEFDPMGRVFIVNVVSKDPPIDVVQKALCVFPDSLNHNTSSFFAASQYTSSTDIIRVLINHILQQGKRDSQEDTNNCPYPWIVVSHISVEGTQVLLEEYPQGVLQSVQGHSSTLCPLDSMITSASSATKTRRCPDPQWWEKLKLMLMVVQFGEVRISEEQKKLFFPVHVFLRRIVSRPEVFFQDRKVAQHIVWLLQQWHLREPLKFQEPDDDANYPLHIVLREKCSIVGAAPCVAAAQELIGLLVKAHPSSARVPTHNDSRLPLNLGLENGWPCHDFLLMAAPEALQTRDMKTFLYPFQTAACSDVSWEGCRSYKKRRTRRDCAGSSVVGALDVTYALLRKDPLQARGLVASASLQA